MATKKTKTSSKGKPTVMTGEVPEWADTAAIGKLLGKGVRRVQQLTQEGVLPTEVPQGGGARKYRTCETVQRYINYVEQKAHENGESGKQAELSVKKLKAEIALKESQGELHMLKTAIAKGDYISAEQAQSELADYMSVFRKFVDAIPSRMAGAMASYTEPEAARTMERNMQKELDSMLTSFVDAARVEAAEEGR